VIISLKQISNVRDLKAVEILLTSLYFVLAFKSDVNIFGFIALISIPLIFYLKKNFLIKVFNIYLFIFSITIIPSLFTYLLILSGIDLPFNTIKPLNILKDNNYSQYIFLVTPENSNVLFPRFCGYYDEPGVVGTIAGVLLTAKRFNIKDKLNVPIFIAGLLSFSLYFYLILIINIFIFEKTKFKIIAASLLLLIITYSYNNEILQELIFKRLTFEDGNLLGDNRSSEYFDTWYESFRRTVNYYWGIGDKSNLIYNHGGASYKDIIVNFGIIYFIFYIGAFSMFGFKFLRFSKQYFIYLLILFSILYQRPFITSLFYIFLIFTPIYVLNED
tara:strand:- start:15135 stop:16127 length:993 start_codon:yes stop_codon:yes gene_type:complete